MIKLFNEKPISELFRILDQKIIQEMNGNVFNETSDSETISETIAEKYKIYVPNINLSGTIVLPAMEGIPGNQFEPNYFAVPNALYQVAVVTYTIPFSGDGELFCIQPSQFTYRTYSASLENNLLNFKIYTDYANINLSEEVKRDVLAQAQSITDWIKNNLVQLTQDCTIFNNNLKYRIKVEIDERKVNINKIKNLSNDLNPFK